MGQYRNDETTLCSFFCTYLNERQRYYLLVQIFFTLTQLVLPQNDSTVNTFITAGTLNFRIGNYLSITKNTSIRLLENDCN